MHRAARSSAQAARRRAAREAQRRAEMNDMLHRFQLAGAVFFGIAALALGYALLLRPIEAAPQNYTAPLAPQSTTATTVPAVPQDLNDSEATCIRVQEDWIYTAVPQKDGSAIFRCRSDGSGSAQVLSSEGEITAFDFDADGNLWFTAITKSGGALYRAGYDGWGATVEAIVTQIDGTALSCPSAVVCGADGTVYFADAAQLSAEDGLQQALYTELLAHTATGRVYAYDPATRTVERVLSGIAGATGLALSSDGQTLYVAELAGRCIWKLDATARDRTVGGRGCEVFAEGLAYYPAALACGEDGMIYAAWLLPYNEWLENHADSTFQRGVVLRLPTHTQAKILNADADTGAGAYNADGELQFLFAASGYGGTTALSPTANGIYLGTANGVCYIPD
jgi:hypothetical protein